MSPEHTAVREQPVLRSVGQIFGLQFNPSILQQAVGLETLFRSAFKFSIPEMSLKAL